MRTAAPLLLLLLAAARAADNDTDTTTARTTDADETLDTITLANGTIIEDVTNSTLDSDDEHEPIVRKKRTFGDIVFRGLADVLGYNVQRKQPQAAFPPPVAPVPGIDLPLQAAPAAAPAPAPAPAPAAAPPCGAPRAAGPPPCRAQKPPPPPPKPKPPPCPRPRAAPKPKPRPPPPPPPPPPCPQPKANTPAPCAPPPPPKQQADPNLETISSRFQLSFNFERSTAAPAAQEAEVADDQQELTAPFAPIAIEPKAAKLPLAQQREPRVFVDAFVLRNGQKRRVSTVDAKVLNSQQAPADDDYLADYEEEAQQAEDDDYEDVQESRDQAVKQFGKAVNQFWEKKKKQAEYPLPEDHYQKVHFGDRQLTNQIRRSGGRESHQSLQRGNADANTIHLPLPDAEDEEEVTTTTEDPRQPLRPRVLPPTEHNPGQIDTVTVRVPPIYKEKRPKKLHREHPERPDRDENDSREALNEQEYEQGQSYRHSDADGEDSITTYQTEAPIRRRRRRKQRRKTRSAEEKDESDDVDVFALGDYDYFGKKLPISKEEEFFRGLTIPPPTKDADLARIEDQSPKEGNGHFLSDHERLREDPEKLDKSGRLTDSGRLDDSGRADDSGRTDDSGKIESDDRPIKDRNRKRSEKYRADASERSDVLSPNAKVLETGYRNNYVHAKNVQVDDPRPRKVV